MTISSKYAKYWGAFVFLACLQACSPNYSYKEKAVPGPVQLSPRLSKLFSKTKLVCFGRYALEIPVEAQLVWGSASFPSDVEVFPGGLDVSKQRIKDHIAELNEDDKTVEITYNQAGPVENSWQIRYYPNEFAKSDGLYFFNTYINKGELTFLLSGAIENGETEDAAASREAMRAKSLRLRTPDEIPAEPGYCIEHGFMAGSSYEDQEMVNAGIMIPSLPDISFSVSSNKMHMATIRLKNSKRSNDRNFLYSLASRRHKMIRVFTTRAVQFYGRESATFNTGVARSR